jgi:hypothetical protein
LEWLKTKHISDMLKVKGFKHSTLFIDDGNEKKTHDVVSVHYIVDSRESLVNYFQNEAKEMRQEGIDKFGGKFTAHRRILRNDFELRSE